ncbi:LytR family transcriptional regulator [Clostridium polyendosporum]|uniref:LytR family transcriptional regulator n=1 Tax=Clostridium polyendosporum TaxID=69208 RepID=A0A919VFC8_9CLOT|nr:LCP family protein [Clostridium polyendosporum]GIM28290.1 LytR family transcriptional regulator [Clostridium polyendosporum]
MVKRAKHSRKNNKSNKKTKVIVLTILFILIFIIGFGAFYTYNLLNKVNKTEISKSNDDLGIDNSVTEQFKDKEDDIINIAFFGVDQMNPGERGRSDSTMVLTIDTKTKKIKMTSIMRDSYVAIEGYGKDKLNHAYAFGGPQLAIKTLNQNYGLNIKDFVAVNFGELSKIIDELGGVDINIKDYEVKMVNAYIDSVADIIKQPGKHISQPGLQTLSGVQAVAYTRIRYVGNGDFERTERQRTVLTALFNKIKNAGVANYPSMVNKLLPYVETSLSSINLIKIGTNALSTGVTNLEQERFPLDGYCTGATINGVWYLKFDEEATKEQMQKYIFEDVKPTAATPKF